MKPVKNFVFAALLVFTLAFNTFAGDVDQPGGPKPEPPRATAPTDETIPENNTDQETADYLFFEVLTALLSVY